MTRTNKQTLRNTLVVCLAFILLVIYFATQASLALPLGERFGSGVFGVSSLLIFEPLFGLITLPFSPFSYAFVGLSAMLFASLLALQKLVSHVRKTAIDYNFSFSAISIGSILLWVTLLFSYRTLPEPAQLTDPAATGGFPLKAFDYPVPPMGSNVPPLEMWPAFFWTMPIWFLIAIVLSALLYEKQSANSKLRYRLYFAAVYVSLVGLGYVTLMFD